MPITVVVVVVVGKWLPRRTRSSAVATVARRLPSFDGRLVSIRATGATGATGAPLFHFGLAGDWGADRGRAMTPRGCESPSRGRESPSCGSESLAKVEAAVAVPEVGAGRLRVADEGRTGAAEAVGAFFRVWNADLGRVDAVVDAEVEATADAVT